MSTAFTTSLSGMLSSQFMLDVTANNLANTETPGFKAGRADFAAQLSNLVDAGQAPKGSTGGRNPVEVGQGVNASSVQRVFTQGGLEPTGRDLDLAIDGNAFFRLKIQGSEKEVYTRVGNFGFDGDNTGPKMVDLSTGAYVLDTFGRTITPQDQSLAVATSTLTLSGNLSPNDPEPMHGASLGSLLPLKTTSGLIPGATTLLRDTTLVQNPTNANVTLNIVGTMGDGTEINIDPAKLPVITPTTTIADFVNQLNQALVRPRLTGTEPFAEVSFDRGSFTVKSKDGGNKLSIFLGEQPVPAATDADRNTWQYGTATDAFDWKQMRLMPSSINTDLKLRTADGTLHTVAGKFINTGLSAAKERTWDLVLEKPDFGILPEGADVLRGLTMDAGGRNISGFTSSTMNTTFDIGGNSTVALDTAGMTGFGGDGFVDASDSTGYPVGFLTTTTIDSEGHLTGFYSNGKTQVMEKDGKPIQIGLVTFINPTGLSFLANNMYQVSQNSGTAAEAIPGGKGTNRLSAGALEGSNVELSGEFSRLIISQRGFQSNSKAFQIADQMIQDANGLIR